MLLIVKKSKSLDLAIISLFSLDQCSSQEEVEADHISLDPKLSSPTTTTAILLPSQDSSHV